MNPSSHRDFPPILRRCFQQGAILIVAVLSPMLMLLGCTSPKYKAAPKKTPPPVLLNLPSSEPPIEALLQTVIIYRGPGSWKLNAYWDEYLVTVANRGNALIEVDSVWLTDFQTKATASGTNPWELELVSRALADKGFGEAKNAAVVIGGGIGVLAIGGGIGAAVFSGAAYIGSAGGAAIAGMIFLPAVIGGTIYTNVSNRHAIEREFERRRLVLPAVLVPGQLAQGSLFFRISPGPQRLTLKCRVDGEPREVVIDLTPLAGLHLKSPPEAPAPDAAPTAPPHG